MTQLIYPGLVAVVSAVFAAMLFTQWAQRRKPHQLWWAVSLSLSAVGAAAFMVSLWLQGSPFFFRIYYLAGAVMMVAYLGTGSVWLAWPGPIARVALWATHLLSLAGAVVVFAAPVDMERLQSLEVDPGVGVLDLGAGLAVLILMNTYGTLAVVGVALRSLVHLVRRQAPTRAVAGMLLIALGTLICGAAGTAARLQAGGFWLALALGTCVLFAGFLAVPAGQRPSHTVQG